jgi:hypothetical protein
MERQVFARNAIVQGRNGQSTVACAERHLNTQVAALDATIAYCEAHRQRFEGKAKALEAICAELQLRKARPN